MEVEIRIDEGQQIVESRERHLARAELQHDGAVLRALDARGIDALGELDRAGNARAQFGEGTLGVLVLRHLDIAQTGCRTLGRVAGDLHLTRQGEHVREQPRLGEREFVDVLRLGVRFGLVEDVRETAQRVHESRHAGLVHRYGHGCVLGIAEAPIVQ